MILNNDDESYTHKDDYIYIVTTDNDTADELSNLGFELILAEQNKWVFRYL